MTDPLFYIPATVTGYPALHGIGRLLAWWWDRGAVTVSRYAVMPTDRAIRWGTFDDSRFILIRLPFWQWELDWYRHEHCWCRAFLLWRLGRGFELGWVPCGDEG